MIRTLDHSCQRGSLTPGTQRGKGEVAPVVPRAPQPRPPVPQPPRPRPAGVLASPNLTRMSQVSINRRATSPDDCLGQLREATRNVHEQVVCFQRAISCHRRDAGREKELGFPKYRAGLHRSGSAPGAMRVWSPKLGWHRYGDMGFSICVAATRMPVS